MSTSSVSSDADCFGGLWVDDGDASAVSVAFPRAAVISSTSSRRCIDKGPVKPGFASVRQEDGCSGFPGFVDNDRRKM